MRIALVTETWLPSTDGVVTRLVATVRELLRAGHEVLVVAPRGDGMEFAGATVRSVPTVGWQFLYGGKRWGLPVPRVARYLREFRPDLVHVVNPVLLGIAGVAVASRHGWPLVASYHTDVARYAEYYRLGWLRPVIWWALRTMHGRAGCNLVTSDAAGAELSAQGIGNVRLWPRGVDLRLFSPAPASGGPDRGPGPGAARRPVALYVGRLAAEKQLPRLAPLADGDSEFQLVLVGDGPQRAELAGRFTGSWVRFTGTLHGDSLAEAYRRADVFVFPSTTETLGLVLLEALASGIPVVAADSPASRESLTGCDAARLFPADHPELLLPLVRELLASAPRATLARQARAHAERWSWSAATEQLLRYYRQVGAGAAVK